MPGRVGLRVGLRPRLTAVCTGVVALVSALLLWLGWLLVGGVAQAPSLPPGSLVRVGGRIVPSEQVSAAVDAAARAEVLRAGLIAFPLVVVAAALLSWWLVGRVLGPLHAVTATARRLSVESLDTRTGVRDARGEVAELAAGFDAMLDRLQAAFEAQRRFVANASHELRTPLSVLRTEVDVTLSDPAADVDELRRMGAVVREATRRADDLVAGLLLLARAESGAELGERAPLNLADLVVPALAGVRADATARGLRVLLRTAPAPTYGDPVLVERVVGNLLENAVRHNVAGGWLEVCTGPVGAAGYAGGPVDGTGLVVGGGGVGVGGNGAGGGRSAAGAGVAGGLGVAGGAELRVASSGPEVAPEQVDELFEPFRRGRVERTGAARGAGLGLSIVRAVVLAHGGTVEARPVVGGGLSVTVRLPT